MHRSRREYDGSGGLGSGWGGVFGKEAMFAMECGRALVVGFGAGAFREIRAVLRTACQTGRSPGVSSLRSSTARLRACIPSD